MSGGYRPNSGRKKGSIPWNKGKKFPQMVGNTNGFKVGQIPWNKGKKVLSIGEKMKGNKNGKANKGRIYGKETIKKMSITKKGKPSHFKGMKVSLESREKNRQSHYRRLLKKNPNFIPVNDIRGHRIIRNGGFHSRKEWETLKAQYNWTCPSCKLREPFNQTYKYLTRDHIIPISMGGSDNIENIQPLCLSCNSKKQAKDIMY